MNILNNRDARKILDLIDEHWGCSTAFLLKEFTVVTSEKKKAYLLNRECAATDIPKTSVNSMGLYFANMKDKNIRLTIEGSQLIGPHATKNVVEISGGEAKLWIHGHSLERTHTETGYVIVRCGEDFLGTGYHKEGTILNFVPKVRRLHTAE